MLFYKVENYIEKCSSNESHLSSLINFTAELSFQLANTESPASIDDFGS